MAREPKNPVGAIAWCSNKAVAGRTRLLNLSVSYVIVLKTFMCEREKVVWER